MTTTIKIQANGTQFFSEKTTSKTGESAYYGMVKWLETQNKAIDTANGNRYPRTITITNEKDTNKFSTLHDAKMHMMDVILYA